MRKMVTAVAIAATCAAWLTSVRAQDSKATLEAAAKALGDVNSIQYSGGGTNNAYGQAFKPGDPWPAFKVTSYTVTVDYKTPAMRMELERTNPEGKVRGGGGLPLLAPQKQNQSLSGKVAWNVNPAPPAGGQAPPPAAAPAAVNDRLIALWGGGSAGAASWAGAPHGVIKGALANNATVAGRVVTYSVAGTQVKATLNSANLVDKVETMADAPVLGDVAIETTYSGYRDFNGVKFPTRIVQREGGFPILDITITDVKPNVNAALDVPQAVQQAQAPAAPAVTVNTEKVADGVYYLTGGTHHSVAVEFNDHVVVFEAPQTEARAIAVFDAVKKALPNKPIRYVVNSHNHFDHLGGVRAAMAEGYTVITQAGNKSYYEKTVASAPHTIVPDRLAKSPKKPTIEAVADKRVLTDGNQTLELYRVPNDHTDTMLVGYLPKAKILIEADLWNPPAANAPPSQAVSPVTAAFYDSIQKMNLGVQKVAGLHGRLAEVKEFQAAAGKSSTH